MPISNIDRKWTQVPYTSKLPRDRIPRVYSPWGISAAAQMITIIANSKCRDCGEGFLIAIQTNNATETMIPVRLKVSGMFPAKSDTKDTAKITLVGMIISDRFRSVGLEPFIFGALADAFEELWVQRCTFSHKS